MVASPAFVPERGDVVWLSFTPQAGHEQAGRRPVLALLCPITSQLKGHPFEVPLPVGLAVRGVVLSDQVKSLDWRARDASLAGHVPPATVAEVLAKLGALLA